MTTPAVETNRADRIPAGVIPADTDTADAKPAGIDPTGIAPASIKRTAVKTKHIAPSPKAEPALAQFPDFPPRDDMMNTRHLHDVGHQPALRLHLGHPDTTVVLGEVPVAWDVPAGRLGVRIPDLLVAFNIRHSQVLTQKGYSILEQGKPPDFVLEVASDHTSKKDELAKWNDYAAYGVAEYWLFDPDWGLRYARGLTGWTLVQGRYEPIPIHESAPDLYYGYSAALGLYVCWEHGAIRWYDTAAGYLLTHDEERSGRIAERNGRIAERDGRIAERSSRIAAEAARDAAVSEVQILRDEIARLRAATESAGTESDCLID